MMKEPVIRRLCLAATMTHVLPGARAELEWSCGARRVVGNHPSADAAPCTWHDAVVQSAATGALAPHEALFGVRGAPRLTVLPGPEQVAMGAGVFRQGPVDVFVTRLARDEVHEAVRSCRVSGRARIGTRRDELTGVTVVAIGHLTGEPPADAGLAWALSMACALDEVSLYAS